MQKLINILIIFAVLINIPLWNNILATDNPSTNLEIYFLNIGQGDSILIKTPDNRFGLIDAGDGTSITNELSSVLPSYFNGFDFILLTHPDADHVAGMIPVMKRYKVDKVFIEKVNKDTNVYKEINTIILSKHLNNFSLNSQTDFNIGEVKFDIVWPEPGLNTYTDFKDSNDTSISLVINYKDFSIFTAGDLPKTFEEKAISDSNYKDIDILKVGHHGSDTSTSENFMNMLHPKVSVISVGKKNRYGHPKQSVLRILENYKSDIYRTDMDGRVTISTDGNSATVKTESGRTRDLNVN
jgi:competence protein ComEC